VLYTGGLALTTFGIIYWLVDVKKSRKWTLPFTAYGANCLAVYLASGFVASAFYAIQIPMGTSTQSLHEYLYGNLFASWLSPINASAAWAFSLILFWLIPLWWLYKKKIFIKI
jgi:predicted acyltransferase